MFFWVFPRRQCVICRRFGTMYQFHLQRLEVDCLLPAFEDGTGTWFRNVGILHTDAGEIPRRTYTIFKSWRKLEICNSNGTLREDQYTFLFIISHSILLRMRNVSDKICRENQYTHFVSNNFFF